MSGRLLRRFGRRGSTPEPGAAVVSGTESGTGTGTGLSAEPPCTVRDEFRHRYLLRSSAIGDSPIRALVRELPADARRPAVVVDVPPAAAGNLGQELGGLLALLREEDPLAVRLVLSGAAAPAGETGPLAQRLADAWEVTLEAPDAPAVLTPGGLLYVTEPATPGGGWWRFAPGATPEALGTRLPAPRWQRALARVPLGPVGEGVVRAVPAGLALSPADAAAPRPDEPAYAVAVHPDRLSVLLGAPRAEPVTAEDVATLLAGLPAEPRRALRLVPADGREAVALAEEVCDLLGTELEVCLGLPVTLTVAGSDGEAEADADADADAECVRLLSPEGEFTWPALLTSLVCSPTGEDGSRPAPRPSAWAFPPNAGTPGAEPATLRLPSGVWAVAVRSGLWLGAAPEAPPEVRELPAQARALRVELAPDCLAEKSAREACLKDLTALLAGLDAAARAHAELAVPDGAEPEAVAGLRRFAVRTGLTLATPPRREGSPARSPQTPTAPEALAPHGSPAEPASTPSPAALPATAPPPTECGPTAGSGPATAAGPATRPEAAAEADPAAGPAAEPSTPSSPGAPRTEGGTAATALAAPVAAPRTTSAPSRPVTASAQAAPETASAPGAAAPRAAGHLPVAAATGTGRTSATQATAPSAVGTVPALGAGTPAVPATARPGATGSTPAPASPAPAVNRVPATLATPRSRPHEGAAEPDRRAFRELASGVWEKHSGPVSQALIRLPALRGSGEEAALADLIAVHLYLSSSPDDPFGAQALAEEADGALRPYAACLASGLRRLPALRGTLVRAVAPAAVPDDVVPGALVECDAPLDVVHVDAQHAPQPPPSHVRYAIRPLTARRTSILSRDGNGAQALFGTGAAFTVLARHEATGDLPARILLAELPTGTSRFRAPSSDAVERLDAIARRTGPAGAVHWPDRCTGPFHRVPPTP
ncbi:hypothetical protein ACIOG8_34920 [Streptomyces erythrochromogenes]|uniref:hypothetical protein n=1 Tax=Streptomyces erythrochromogenes TaxID=285574 RepID=UPI0037F1E2FE